MTINFETKSGKKLIGEVVWTGYYDVDKPESHKVSVKEFPHINFWVPIDNG